MEQLYLNSKEKLAVNDTIGNLPGGTIRFMIPGVGIEGPSKASADASGSVPRLQEGSTEYLQATTKTTDARSRLQQDTQVTYIGKVSPAAYELSQYMPVPPFSNLPPSEASLKVQQSKRRRSKFTAKQDETILDMKSKGHSWVQIAESAGVGSYLAARNRYQVLIGQQGGGNSDTGPDDVLALRELLEEGEHDKWEFLAKTFQSNTGKRCTAAELRELVRCNFWSDPSRFNLSQDYVKAVRESSSRDSTDFGTVPILQASQGYRIDLLPQKQPTQSIQPQVFAQPQQLQQPPQLQQPQKLPPGQAARQFQHIQAVQPIGAMMQPVQVHPGQQPYQPVQQSQFIPVQPAIQDEASLQRYPIMYQLPVAASGLPQPPPPPSYPVIYSPYLVVPGNTRQRAVSPQVQSLSPQILPSTITTPQFSMSPMDQILPIEHVSMTGLASFHTAPVASTSLLTPQPPVSGHPDQSASEPTSDTTRLRQGQRGRPA